MIWEVGGGALGSGRGWIGKLEGKSYDNRTFAGRNQERNQVGNQMTEKEEVEKEKEVETETEHTLQLHLDFLARPSILGRAII